MMDQGAWDAISALQNKLDRQDKAMRTLVSWLVQAQTGFGARDARGIEKILDGKA